MTTMPYVQARTARRRVGIRSRRDWKGVQVHALAVGAVGVTHLLLAEAALTLRIGGGISFVVYLALALRELRRTPLGLTPLSFYLLWYSVGLGLAPWWVASQLEGNSGIAFSVALVSADEVARGYLIYLMGSLALHLGLQAFRPLLATAAPERPRRAPRINLAFVIGMWIVGLLVLWYPHLTAPLGAPGRLLRWSAITAVAVVALADRDRLGLSSVAQHGLVVGGTAGLLVANLMSFSKAYIMFSFLPLLWMYYLAPRKRRWLPLVVGGVALVYLTVIAPVVTAARLAPLGGAETTSSRLITGLREQAKSGLVLPGAGELNAQGHQFMKRMFDPLAVAYLVGEVERTGLQRGRTMTYAAYAFIPRVLWPDKPTVTRGAWFAHYIGFAESESEATMSLGITAVGELYWNFGIPGVGLGMLLIGVLISGLWRVAGVDPRGDPIRMLLYVTLLFSMSNMSEAVTVVVSLTVAFLTFKTVLIAVRPPESRQDVYARHTA